MNCEQVKTVIPRYLAGESQESEAVAIEEHLAGCDHCGADLEADRQVDASLRAAMLEEELDTSSVIRRVVARMEHVPWWRRAFAVGMLRFAAVSALVLVSLAVGHRIYVHQLEKGIAMAATHDHYMDLVVLKRTDWAYSGQSSARFVQSNFPETPELVRLITPAGGTFEKVRLCSLNGTHYAHFVFRMPAGEVSVFIRATRTDERTYTPAVVHDQTKRLEVAGFSSPGFVGAVVGQDGLVPTEMIAAQTAKVL
jgi:anti-sigma factor RsiW